MTVTVDRRKALGGLAGIAACLTLSGTARAASRDEGRFLHGVASGDPLQDRVILWTRVTPDRPDAARLTVEWEIATDAAFRHIVGRGQAETGAERDFTVKVDAAGLRPMTRYHYRFRSGERLSPVGQTQTLPAGRVDQMVIAVASCALYSCGFFNGYREIANLPRLDLVLHLGDYIYEYGGAPDQLGMTIGEKIGRVPLPLNEAVTLADYRQRHACYRADPDLQAAHARAPWICVWDDHEAANDSWPGGAQNHDAGEGDWTTRRDASVQAYLEWIPLREPAPGQPRTAINRTFELGDLATLVMLENRYMGRSRQVDLRNPKDVAWQAVDLTDPARPAVVTDRALAARLLGAAAKGEPLPAPYDLRVDVESLRRAIADPSRSVLGDVQENWLRDQLRASASAGKPWQLIGNEVVMARTTGADIIGAFGPERWSRAIQAAAPKLRPWLKQIATLPADIPFEFDGWNAYPGARARMNAILSEAGVRPIVLSGDSHAFWINELSDAAHPRLAAEIGTTAITSSSLGNMLGNVELGPAFTEGCPEVLYCNQLTKGFALLTLRADEARVDLIGLSTVLSRSYQAFTLKSARIRPGATGGIAAIDWL
ncbi:alkaline phosphatase D family protein [Parapedomonas caeni]